MGPQATSSSDRQGQFSQDAEEVVKIQLFDSWGSPLHSTLINEIK